jgi:hypothetical protein
LEYELACPLGTYLHLLPTAVTKLPVKLATVVPFFVATSIDVPLTVIALTLFGARTSTECAGGLPDATLTSMRPDKSSSVLQRVRIPGLSFTEAA